LEVGREQSMDYMETTAEQLRTQGVRATVLLRRGNTAPTLAEAARQSDAGLVVIATHARAGLDAIWTGSIAATLVERVTVPVVMVKIAPPK
jgi:nucleotide-binding universal stress UspA family protein